MRQRLAIAISGVVAAGVLTVGLAAAGFGPEPRPDVRAAVDAEAVDRTVEDTEPEVVYIKPAPTPETVVVTKRAKPADGGSGSASRQVRAARSGDDDDEAEHRRESAKERRDERRESAKERREERREREREDEDD
jgi:hypothetical protein